MNFIPSVQAGLRSLWIWSSPCFSHASTRSSRQKCINVIKTDPISAGIPAIINDQRYEWVSSYNKPAIGAPAVIGMEHKPSKKPIPWVAPFAPHKSKQFRNKQEIKMNKVKMARKQNMENIFYHRQQVQVKIWSTHRQCPCQVLWQLIPDTTQSMEWQ